MNIPVTLNLLKDRHTSNFEWLGSMSLIYQESDYLRIILFYEPESTTENFVICLEEACKELRSFYVNCDNPPKNWPKREEYFICGFNYTEHMIMLQVRGNSLDLCQFRKFLLKDRTEIIWGTAH
jgi:hypothetical protein